MSAVEWCWNDCVSLTTFPSFKEVDSVRFFKSYITNTCLSDRMVATSDATTRSPPRPFNDTRQPGRKNLDIPIQDSCRTSSDDNASIYSADHENERQRERLLHPEAQRHQSISPAPLARSWKTNADALWVANKGLVLVLISQLFGALMNVTTRLLETSGNPLNTFQVCHHAPRLGSLKPH